MPSYCWQLKALFGLVCWDAWLNKWLACVVKVYFIPPWTTRKPLRGSRHLQWIFTLSCWRWWLSAATMVDGAPQTHRCSSPNWAAFQRQIEQRMHCRWKRFYVLKTYFSWAVAKVWLIYYLLSRYCFFVVPFYIMCSSTKPMKQLESLRNSSQSRRTTNRKWLAQCGPRMSWFSSSWYWPSGGYGLKKGSRSAPCHVEDFASLTSKGIPSNVELCTLSSSVDKFLAFILCVYLISQTLHAFGSCRQ